MLFSPALLEIEKSDRLSSLYEVVERKRWFGLADFNSQEVDRQTVQNLDKGLIAYHFTGR